MFSLPVIIKSSENCDDIKMKSRRGRKKKQSDIVEGCEDGENKAKISKLGAKSPETAIRVGDVIVKSEPVDFNESDDVLFGQCSQLSESIKTESQTAGYGDFPGQVSSP